MKTPAFSPNTLLLAFLFAFLLSSAAASAQTRLNKAPLLGYWNVETNLTTRDYTFVRFYNAQHQLVYEERLPDLCLDLGRSTGPCHRTTRQLNAVLRQVLQADPAALQPNQLALRLSQQRRVQRVYAVR